MNVEDKVECLLSIVRTADDEDPSADYYGYFDWKFGGDGDNGEALREQLQRYFRNHPEVDFEVVVKDAGG